MNPYLDSIEFYNSINYDQEQKKPNKKYSKNDERIGKISLVLIIAFVAYIIWTIVDAYAYGAPDNDICTGDEGTLCNSNATAQSSSQEIWNSSAPIQILSAEEQRLFEVFLELGEEQFRKDCYKNLNSNDVLVGDFMKDMPKDMIKDVCENRINKIKNETGTLQQNQTLDLVTGETTYTTHNDYSNGFSVEYPTDWHVSQGGGKIFKGTREFTMSNYDDPKYSVLDTDSFGNIIFDVWKDKDGVRITDNLGQIMIGNEPALSFSYSELDKEVMVVALMHNNVGYVFEYGTLKDNFDKDFDTMMHFIGTLRLN